MNVEEKQQKWYASGVRAHKRGYGNFSPFYENATADYFFKCGYEGVSFIEAQQALKEKIEQELNNDSILNKALGELTTPSR